MNETLTGRVSSETLRDILLGLAEDLCTTQGRAHVAMQGHTCRITLPDATITICGKGGAV
ncbi:MAG: hypothetical protein K2H87_04940 [Duncaniella sp.]|nr:hypothetical protein [Duncaniella sp.]